MMHSMSDDLGSTWRPIDSAPKDYTPILAFDAYRGMQVVRWGSESIWDQEGHWVYGECEGEYNSMETLDHITHWMPLPPAPEQEK